MSQQLDISRGSLREGLAILEFLGVISNKGNRKIVERDYQTVQSMLGILKLTEKSNIIYDFIEFRSFIEMLNVRLACERATDEDIENLELVIKSLENDFDSSESDYSFHMGIAKASKNEFLVSITELLLAMVNDIRPKLIKYPGRKPFFEEECYQIFNAIVERDVEKAQSAMKDHLIFIESTLKAIDSLED